MHLLSQNENQFLLEPFNCTFDENDEITAVCSKPSSATGFISKANKDPFGCLSGHRSGQISMNYKEESIHIIKYNSAIKIIKGSSYFIVIYTESIIYFWDIDMENCYQELQIYSIMISLLSKNIIAINLSGRDLFLCTEFGEILFTEIQLKTANEDWYKVNQIFTIDSNIVGLSSENNGHEIISFINERGIVITINDFSHEILDIFEVLFNLGLHTTILYTFDENSE